jgi:hypothetical protein
MARQFAQVSVSISAPQTLGSVYITALGHTQVGGGKRMTAFNPYSKTFTAADTVQTVIWNTIPNNATNVVAKARTVYPVAPAPTAVSISDMQLNVRGVATVVNPAGTARYNHTLNAGSHYSLVFEIREMIFAGSNIYWDGTKLTFAPPHTSAQQTYQGLYFKYGSLVGISPVNETWSSRPIYAPNSSGGWDGPVTSRYASFAVVPRITLPNSAVSWDDPWLSGDENNTSALTGALKGDICRYISDNDPSISGDWRMPTTWEMQGYTYTEYSGTVAWISSSLPNEVGWIRGDGAGGSTWPTPSPPATADGRAGKYDISVYGGVYMGNTFPASGVYGLTPFGDGYYWTSSLNGPAPRLFTLGPSGVSGVAYLSPTPDEIACTVRCIRIG